MSNELPRLGRIAKVVSKSSSFDTISTYLSANYRAFVADGVIHIVGHDVAGWTLDGFIIPRLGSGLHVVEELDSDLVPSIRVGEDQFAVVDETTGELLDEVEATEQCDDCGGTYGWALDTIVSGVTTYDCIGCGHEAVVSVRSAGRVVFQ